MPPSSTSSYQYSRPCQNSYECTGLASHSYKSPVSRTTNPDTHRGRVPSCTPNTPPAAAPCLPPGPPSDIPTAAPPRSDTTDRSANPRTPTPRHAQTTANSSARVSRGTLPLSPARRPPCPCEPPPSPLHNSPHAAPPSPPRAA